MVHPHPSTSSPHSEPHLRVDGVSFSFPDRRVLTDVSFIVPPGAQVGLIGENGCGKSTLLRLVAGLLTPSAGTISIVPTPIGQRAVGLLHQQPPFKADESIATAIEHAVVEARQAAAAVTTLGEELASNSSDSSVGRAFAAALDTAELLDAWNIDGRISQALDGLGLGSLPRDRITGSLSGGQRARLALAWTLLNAPAVLLLDEPTNHLDDDATAFLLSEIVAHRGPVLMASHDRAFLDEAATSLLDLDPAPLPHSITGPLSSEGANSGIGVVHFGGGYTEYLRVQDDAHQRWQQQYRHEQDELSKLRSQVTASRVSRSNPSGSRSEVRIARKFFADRGAKVVSRRVNDAQSRLEQLEKNQIRKPPPPLLFQGLTAAGQPKRQENGPVIVSSGLVVRDRLTRTSLAISQGEKWLITGPNGSGKSTLLSVLAGRLPVTKGQISHLAGIRIGLLSQEVDLLAGQESGTDPTVQALYAQLIGDRIAQQIPLSTFGLIRGLDQNRPVSALSVGQQRRLALAAVLANPPDLLLLDEPTNHFSLSLVTALEQALSVYPGTVVVASHDRWLRARWQGKILTLACEEDSM